MCIQVRYFANDYGTPLPSLSLGPVIKRDVHLLYGGRDALGVRQNGSLYRVNWCERIWNWIVNLATFGHAAKEASARLEEVVRVVLEAVQEKLKNLQQACDKCHNDGYTLKQRWLEEHKGTLFLPLGVYPQKPWRPHPDLEPYENLGAKILSRFDQPGKHRGIRDLAWSIERLSYKIRIDYDLKINGRDDQQYS